MSKQGLSITKNHSQRAAVRTEPNRGAEELTSCTHLNQHLHNILDNVGDRISKHQLRLYAFSALILSGIICLLGRHLFELPNAAFNLIAWSLISMIGVTLGYHRYFTHRSFQASRPLVVALGVAALLSAQGKLKHWVARHRLHHRYTDSIYDPHSPFEMDQRGNGTKIVTLRSFLWAHWIWQLVERSEYFRRTGTRELNKLGRRKDVFTYTKQLKADLKLKQLGWDLRDWYSKDIQQDPITSQLDRYYPAIWLLSISAPIVLSITISAIHQTMNANQSISANALAASALSGLTWGFLARLVLVQELTNMINSTSHIVGYCNSQRPDNTIRIGRNTPVLALLNLGESYHHNHHLNPKDPNFGKRWFELDIAYQCLRLLALTGLVRMKSNRSEHID